MYPLLESVVVIFYALGRKKHAMYALRTAVRAYPPAATTYVALEKTARLVATTVEFALEPIHPVGMAIVSANPARHVPQIVARVVFPPPFAAMESALLARKTVLHARSIAPMGFAMQVMERVVIHVQLTVGCAFLPKS